VLVDRSVHDQFIQRLKHWFDVSLNETGDQMCRIVNEWNFDRLSSLLEKTDGKIF